MPVTSRQKILEHLKRNRTASSSEIARALRMTPANARRHLGILSGDGRVDVTSRRQSGSGRPEKMYSLSGALAGDNLPALVDSMIVEAGANLKMEALGKRLAGETAPVHQPLMRRLSDAVERLNAMHYQAHWEAGAEGPRFLFGLCPYAAIIGAHPELCRMDAALLEALLGMDALQIAKIEPGGSQSCIFLLGRS